MNERESDKRIEAKERGAGERPPAKDRTDVIKGLGQIATKNASK